MSTRASRSEVSAEDIETLTISPEKVCFVIIKAREFDAKDEVTEPDPGSNPSDDGNAAIPKTTTTTPWSRSSHRSSIPCRKMSRSTSWR
jgi:hypothetical protein